MGEPRGRAGRRLGKLEGGRLGPQNPFLIGPALIHIDMDAEFCKI